MKLNPAYLFVGVAVVALGAWFYVNNDADSKPDIYADINGAKAEAASAPTVVIRRVVAQPHPVELTTYGRTEPARMVEVKAKTAASVVETPVAEGAFVRQGDVICRQDVDARQALLDQARAQLAKAQSDLNATTVLVEKGYRSSAQLSGERAAVDAARAQTKQAEIELGNIVLRAPFSGVYERRMAEVGDYLAPGQACGMVVELNPLKVEMQLTETQVGSVERGQTVTVDLATGQSVTGKIAAIQSVANSQTRTFRVETRLPNSDYKLKAGVSATARFAIGEVEASLIPASIMSLGDDGSTGVRYVDGSDRVRFAAIQQVDESDTGLWVTGLPATARVIIEGQDFVSTGTEVNPVYEVRKDGASSAGLASVADLD